MREISIVSGLQIVSVVLGWCALGVVLKFNGYPDDNPFVRWTPLATWLREYGCWLLCVAPIWTATAIGLERSENRDALNVIVAFIGVLFAVGVFVTFLIATFSPYTRPLAFH